MENPMGTLLAEVEISSHRADRSEAIGWVVVCVDLEPPLKVVYSTGVFDSPEEALVEAGKQEAESAKYRKDFEAAGEQGWMHSVVPLFPPD